MTSATSWRRSLFSLQHKIKKDIIMDSSDYTVLNYQFLNELFPIGLTILAARPAMGKTTFATQVVNHFRSYGEYPLYFCLEYDSKHIFDKINHLDTNKDGIYKCGFVDIPRISIEEVTFIINNNIGDFDVVVIDYIELLYFGKDIDGLMREDGLRVICKSLEKIAKRKGIRIIGISQLPRIRIDGSEKALPDECFGYLDKEFLKDRIRILHRQGYYEDCTDCDNMQPVDIIKYGNDRSYIYSINFYR